MNAKQLIFLPARIKPEEKRGTTELFDEVLRDRHRQRKPYFFPSSQIEQDKLRVSGVQTDKAIDNVCAWQSFMEIMGRKS